MTSSGGALSFTTFDPLTMVSTMPPSMAWQLVLEQGIQPFPQGLEVDPLDDFHGKGAGQQCPGRIPADASRLKVEHLVLVELADRRPVAAFDVVRPDFQLRLGVDLGV